MEAVSAMSIAKSQSGAPCLAQRIDLVAKNIAQAPFLR
jgi:hypothetical protein